MKNKELIEFLLDSILPTVARILFDGLVLFTMGLIILALLMIAPVLLLSLPLKP